MRVSRHLLVSFIAGTVGVVGCTIATPGSSPSPGGFTMESGQQPANMAPSSPPSGNTTVASKPGPSSPKPSTAPSLPARQDPEGEIPEDSAWDARIFVGRPTLALRGDVLDLAIASSGKAIAYFGTPFAGGPRTLYVGKLDGPVQQVADFDHVVPFKMVWTEQDTALTCLVGEDTAMAIYHMKLAEGRTSVVARPPGFIILEPSPTGNQFVWFTNDLPCISKDEGACDPPKIDAPFIYLDAASGEQRSLLRDVVPEGAAWSKDGTKLALMYRKSTDGAITIAVLKAGSAEATTLGEVAHAPNFVEWTTGGALVTAHNEQDQIAVRRFEGGKAPTLTTIPLDNDRYSTNFGSLSPDGKRLLSSDDFPRADVFIPEDPVQNSHPEPHVRNVLIDLDSSVVKPFANGVVPYGWLDNDRMLISTGVGNYKRYSLFNVTDLK